MAPIHAYEYDPKAPIYEGNHDLDSDTYLFRDSLLIKYSETKTVEQFIETFISNRSDEEKKEAAKRLAGFELPKMDRIEYGFRLSSGEDSVSFDLRDMSKHRFVINGVSFTVDPKFPLHMQADILKKKLLENGKKPFSFFSLFLPEAMAVGAVKTIFLSGATIIGMGLVNSGLGEATGDLWRAARWQVCDFYTDQGVKMPRNPEVCKEYRLLLEKQAKEKPENQSVKNALSESNVKSGDIFTTDREFCPFQNDENRYHADIRIIREQPGQKECLTKKNPKENADCLVKLKAKEDEGKKACRAIQDAKEKKTCLEKYEMSLRIYAIIDGDKAKKASVYQDVYLNGKSDSNLIVDFVVDGKSDLKEYKYFSTQTNKSDKMTTNEMTIAADADLAKLPPETRAKRDFFHSIFEHLAKRLVSCNLLKEEADAKKITSPKTNSTVDTGSKKADTAK
jgi:hypothetical protein